MRYKHWANRGIIWLADLREDGLNYIDKEILCNRLRIRAGFIFEFKRLEIAIRGINVDKFVRPAEVPETYQDVADHLCGTKFEVPNLGDKRLDDLSSSDIYSILLLNENIRVRSKEYWIRKFPEESIDFELWFKILFQSKIFDRKWIDFNWRIFHGILNTGNRLKAMGFSNGKCIICGDVIENVEHLLAKCQYVEIIWKEIERKLMKFDSNLKPLSLFNKIVGILNDSNGYEAINMIITIVRWEIWKRRCKKQYGDETIRDMNLLSGIFLSIKRHISILLQTKRIDCRKSIERMRDAFDGLG